MGTLLFQSLPIISFVPYSLYTITAEPSLAVIQTLNASGFVSFVQRYRRVASTGLMIARPNPRTMTLDGSEAEIKEVTGKIVETKNDETTNGSTVRTSET
jgi:hypothetical protein